MRIINNLYNSLDYINDKALSLIIGDDTPNVDTIKNTDKTSLVVNPIISSTISGETKNEVKKYISMYH